VRFRVATADECWFVELAEDRSHALVTPREGGETIRVSISEDPNAPGEELRLVVAGTPHSTTAHRAWLTRSVTQAVSLSLDNHPLELQVETDRERLARPSRRKSAESGLRRVKSLLPGVILSVRCAVGDVVAPDTTLVTLEAMKMENEFQAEIAGRVRAVHVTEGQLVQAGYVLLEVEPGC
jgi:biotin carboxyl carrier protein